mmetsp:Transcript_24339/g.36514  ORF Transcript_24339/g.36514 Transcript_24339/m.36514 type:complete len:1271 (-) Transcript_24339:123-3935(-)
MEGNGNEGNVGSDKSAKNDTESSQKGKNGELQANGADEQIPNESGGKKSIEIQHLEKKMVIDTEISGKHVDSSAKANGKPADESKVRKESSQMQSADSEDDKLVMEILSDSDSVEIVADKKTDMKEKDVESGVVEITTSHQIADNEQNKSNSSIKTDKMKSQHRKENTIVLISNDNKMDVDENSKESDEPAEEDDRCNVCFDPESYEDNPLLYCDKCDVCVHQMCYGVQKIPEGEWFCRKCEAGLSDRQVQCRLCKTKGGAFKRDVRDRWVHCGCAFWLPECGFRDTEKMEPIEGVDNVDPERFKLVCGVCGTRNGASIQCSVEKCEYAVHPLCALKAKHRMFMAEIPKIEDNDDVVKILFCPEHKNVKFVPMKFAKQFAAARKRKNRRLGIIGNNRRKKRDTGAKSVARKRRLNDRTSHTTGTSIIELAAKKRRLQESRKSSSSRRGVEKKLSQEIQVKTKPVASVKSRQERKTTPKLTVSNGLKRYGRNWSNLATYLKVTRDRAMDAAKRFLIRLYIRKIPLYPKLLESGKGYTLSGKKLDLSDPWVKSFIANEKLKMKNRAKVGPTSSGSSQLKTKKQKLVEVSAEKKTLSQLSTKSRKFLKGTTRRVNSLSTLKRNKATMHSKVSPKSKKGIKTSIEKGMDRKKLGSAASNKEEDVNTKAEIGESKKKEDLLAAIRRAQEMVEGIKGNNIKSSKPALKDTISSEDISEGKSMEKSPVTSENIVDTAGEENLNMLERAKLLMDSAIDPPEESSAVIDSENNLSGSGNNPHNPEEEDSKKQIDEKNSNSISMDMLKNAFRKLEESTVEDSTESSRTEILARAFTKLEEEVKGESGEDLTGTGSGSVDVDVIKNALQRLEESIKDEEDGEELKQNDIIGEDVEARERDVELSSDFSEDVQISSMTTASMTKKSMKESTKRTRVSIPKRKIPIKRTPINRKPKSATKSAMEKVVASRGRGKTERARRGRGRSRGRGMLRGRNRSGRGKGKGVDDVSIEERREIQQQLQVMYFEATVTGRIQLLKNVILNREGKGYDFAAEQFLKGSGIAMLIDWTDEAMSQIQEGARCVNLVHLAVLALLKIMKSHRFLIQWEDKVIHNARSMCQHLATCHLPDVAKVARKILDQVFNIGVSGGRGRGRGRSRGVGRGRVRGRRRNRGRGRARRPLPSNDVYEISEHQRPSSKGKNVNFAEDEKLEIWTSRAEIDLRMLLKGGPPAEKNASDEYQQRISSLRTSIENQGNLKEIGSNVARWKEKRKEKLMRKRQMKQDRY